MAHPLHRLTSLFHLHATPIQPTTLRNIHISQRLQSLTSAEVATALRPFIFIVHPDRFWNHPLERSVNECSLKKLNEHLGVRLEEKKKLFRAKASNGEMVTFFMRSPPTDQDTLSLSSQPKSLKKIQIKLNNHENLSTTVHRILSECSLSTDYVQKVAKKPRVVESSNGRTRPKPPMPSQFYQRPGEHASFNNEYFYNRQVFNEMEEDLARVKPDPDLASWLAQNHHKAMDKMRAGQPILRELAQVRQRLIDELGLESLSWNIKWAPTYIRGCLNSLSMMARQYPDDMVKLKGRRVMLSYHCGVGLANQVELSVEDVRQTWLDFIRSIDQAREVKIGSEVIQLEAVLSGRYDPLRRL